MTEDLAWMRTLSPADQEACARDLAGAAGTDHQEAALRAWQETAAAVAEGLGRDEPEWLDEPAAVERP